MLTLLYMVKKCHQSESDFPYTFLPYLLVYFIGLGCFYTEVKHQESSLHSYKVHVLNNINSCWRVLRFIFFISKSNIQLHKVITDSFFCKLYRKLRIVRTG